MLLPREYDIGDLVQLFSRSTNCTSWFVSNFDLTLNLTSIAQFYFIFTTTEALCCLLLFCIQECLKSLLVSSLFSKLSLVCRFHW